LKLFNKCPTNGLVVFCGLAEAEEGNNKAKQVSLHFEPFQPLKYVYRCDNCFHVEDLKTLLADIEDEDPFGFIVMDGNGVLFGRVQGTRREVLKSLSVNLPNKHGRGGQSQLRFERLRREKRNVYVCRVAELATQLFIAPSNNGQGRHNTTKGIILAGSGELKNDLLKHSNFDKRLRKIVVKTVDIAHGGERGFEEAIGLSLEDIGSMTLLHQTQLLQRFMTEVQQDKGRYCFSVDDTVKALEMGAVEKLILYEDLDMTRYEIEDSNTGIKRAVHTKDEVKVQVDESIIEQQSFVTWVCENYKEYGCSLEFVTDQMGVARQFIIGFGGVGAILRWAVDFSILEEHDDRNDDNDDDDVTKVSDALDDESSSLQSDINHGDYDYGFDDGEYGF